MYWNEIVESSHDDVILSKIENIKNYAKIDSNEVNIKKYRQQYPLLKHVKTGKNYKGIILLDNDIFVGVLQCDIIKNYIVALEISPKYRNQGIASYLLDIANNEFNANNLSVNKKNIKAINLYKKCGYAIDNEDDNMFYMSKNNS